MVSVKTRKDFASEDDYDRWLAEEIHRVKEEKAQEFIGD